MFTKIASFAAAATLIVATIAPPAHAAGGWVNGVELNGVELNGQKSNGQKSNGTDQITSGFVIDGIELPAAQ